MIYDPPSINGIQKTLDAQLLSGITASMTLNNVTGIQDKPGVCVVDLIDANEKFTPAKREYISFTGVSGNTLTGLTRNADSGGSDQDHAVGAIVQFPADVLQQQAIIDNLPASLVDAKGDLIVGSAADTPARLAVGSDGYKLIANSNETTGLQYIAPNGWEPIFATLTYASSTTMNTSVDLTAYIQVKDLIVITQSSTLKYFEVTAITSSLITVKGIGTNTVASSTISNPAYFHQYPMGVTQPKSRVYAYNSATQSIPNNTETIIQFDSEFYDTNSEFDTGNYRFTAKKSGYYRVTLSLSFIYATIWSLSLYKSGSYLGSWNTIISTGFEAFLISKTIYMAAGEYIEGTVRQSSGSSQYINNDGNNCFIQVDEL